MQRYYDLHIHSCLSPCGDEEMTPQNIVNMAALAGFDIIAVSDHNTTQNCGAVMLAAERAGITAIPAMELTTREEVHVLCLFPNLDAAADFGKYVYSKLPDILNKPDIFGRQLLMDADDNIIGEEQRLLISATDIGVYNVHDLLKAYGGTAIPAHLDRDSFSLISNLGFYDPDMKFPAVEYSNKCQIKSFVEAHPELKGIRYLINSDAHILSGIPDPRRLLHLEASSAEEVVRVIECGQI